MFPGWHKTRLELPVLVRLVLHSEVKEINLVSGSHTIPDALYRSKSLGTKIPNLSGSLASATIRYDKPLGQASM
jgi:hypothetical protein